jgi:hypothetical protein
MGSLPDFLDRLPLDSLTPHAPVLGVVAAFLALDFFLALRHMRETREMAEARALASHARRMTRKGRA